MDAIELKNPRARAFCNVFVSLWRAQRAIGIEFPRVGRQAAMSAGYGATSWNPIRSLQAADVMYNKLLKQAPVIAYLKELGLERDGRKWREAESK